MQLEFFKMENKELKSIVTNDDITGNIKIVNLKEEDDKSVTKQKEYLETFFYIKKKNGFFKSLYLKIKKFFGIKIKIEDVYDENPRWKEARQLIKRMDNLKKKEF